MHHPWSCRPTAARGAGDAIPTCSSRCPGFAGDKYVFVGPQNLLGEFGWIAAVTMLALGLLAAWWHQRHPVSRVSPEVAVVAA
jgi:hypothetical protein